MSSLHKNHNSTSAKASDPRRLAHQVLTRVQTDGAWSNLTLDIVIQRAELSAVDKNLLSALVMGCVERRVTLDAIIERLSSIPLDTLEPAVLIAMEMGLYQLKYMDRIPDHAAVNETVDLVPSRAKNYVNAVLRNYLRDKQNLDKPKIGATEEESLSFYESFPQPLVHELCLEYGLNTVKQMLGNMQHTDCTTLSVNILKTSVADCMKAFSNAGVNAVKTPLSPFGIQIFSSSVSKLPGFESGLFFVQDEASQLCAMALDVSPGMIVWDACSAPGSKSFSLLMQMHDRGTLYATDLHDNKLSLIRDGACRLGLTHIQIAVHDAKTPFLRDFGNPMQFSSTMMFDRILCDVPCSGFGVMSKKPEIRYKSLHSCEKLPEVQLAILENCAEHLKPGGKLVYSTCTILARENRDIIASFLKKNPSFSLCPTQVGNLKIPDGMITLLPHIHHTDGFFMAVLQKKEE